MEEYLATRRSLITEANPGLAAARELSALTDDAVRDLFRVPSSPPRGRFAVIALGGWGSGTLLPSSDLDLLLLSAASPDRLRPMVEAVLYPLWDAGLAVGHQVRSPREQLRACRTDLQTCTAALTGRVIAGDAEWGDRILADCASDAATRRRHILPELATRARPRSPYRLEPDLKLDAGARRDFDELTWTAAVITARVQHDPGALVGAGLLSAEEFATLSSSAETIAAARFELAATGLGSRMTLDSAESLTAASAEEVQLALAETSLLLGRVRARLEGATSASEAALTPDGVFALLESGDGGSRSCEEAAQSGRLETLLPGFRELMTVRRPGLGHDLTVGAHSLRAAMLVTAPPTEPALARSFWAVERLRVVQVAALAHDAGKRTAGQGHAQRGAQPAGDAARRFGLSEPDTVDVAELVRLHLMLAETAECIDLDDEDAILLAAASIARRELLAPLHVLTAADSRATGPATWSAWKAALVGQLVARIDAAFSENVDGAGIAQRGEAVRVATLERMGDSLAQERAFVTRAPLRYLAGRTAEEVMRHASLVASLSADGARTDTHLAVIPGPVPDTYAVTVVTADKPELLSRIAGAMSLAGLDILAVDAYGAPDGIALDTFVVASATRRPVSTDTFANLDRLLSAALRDRLELRVRLAERRRHYPALTDIPVTVRAISSGFDTSVRVTAPDRPGLLHDLASAVSASGLNIRWARVLTVDGIATDTFHVTDSDGGPVDDDGVIGHLVMRLREVG